jgi:hypothetical protein
MDELKYLLFHTPWWVYFIFIYCIAIGFKSTRPRVISYYRLYIIPTLIAIWSLHGIYIRHSLSAPYLLTWIAALICGISAGWALTYHIYIEADKSKKLIKIPGTWITFILVIVIFLIRYYYGYYHVVDPANLNNPGIVYPEVTLTAFFIGIILGRGIQYSYAYNKATHTDLHRP